jgi:hypothetical protein
MMRAVVVAVVWSAACVVLSGWIGYFFHPEPPIGIQVTPVRTITITP